MLYHSHPLYQHDIPDPSSMDIGKLGSRGALTSDTYNGARRTYSIIFEQVHETSEALHKDESDDIRVLEVDCCNPLRNVWLRGMKNSLSTLLENTIKSLDINKTLPTLISTDLATPLRHPRAATYNSWQDIEI